MTPVAERLRAALADVDLVERQERELTAQLASVVSTEEFDHVAAGVRQAQRDAAWSRVVAVGWARLLLAELAVTS